MAKSAFDDIIDFYRRGTILNKLIIVNLTVFGFIFFLGLFAFFFTIDSKAVSFFVTEYLAAPSNFLLLLTRPWTIITYMFLHEDFFHFISNMIILFFSGRIFIEFLGERRMLATYILGGLSGFALYIASYNVFPVFWEASASGVPILGASASVMAILVAIATYIPNLEVRLFGILPIKLKYIAVFLVILDLVNIQKSNPGGHLAHLGGALFGFMAVTQYQRGKDVFGWFNRIWDNLMSLFRPKSKIKITYSKRKERKAKTKGKKLSDEEYNLNKRQTQKKVDDILDKISTSGYDSLTGDEKDFLFNYSNKK